MAIGARVFANDGSLHAISGLLQLAARSAATARVGVAAHDVKVHALARYRTPHVFIGLLPAMTPIEERTSTHCDHSLILDDWPTLFKDVSLREIMAIGARILANDGSLHAISDMLEGVGRPPTFGGSLHEPGLVGGIAPSSNAIFVGNTSLALNGPLSDWLSIRPSILALSNIARVYDSPSLGS